MNNTNYLRKLVVLALPLAMLAGCGSSDKALAPSGGSISINPASVEWTVTAPPGCTGTNFHFHEVYITVRDSNGRAINDATIFVTLGLSVETSSYDANRLYDDENWIYSPTNPPARRVSGSYATTTGDYGVKRLIVGTDLDCTHLGILSVSSGTVFNSIEIKVE